MGAIDKDVGSLEEAVASAGLVVIATPVMAAKRSDLQIFLQVLLVHNGVLMER